MLAHCHVWPEDVGRRFTEDEWTSVVAYTEATERRSADSAAALVGIAQFLGRLAEGVGDGQG
ncbi:MAG: hypothetical protein M3340_05995 [Actinomycetota bacterium]|nr:hypothetical protein [Actinomycetota bacterium]